MARRKDKAAYGRWRTAATPPPTIPAMLRQCGVEATTQQAHDFRRWLVRDLWEKYLTYEKDRMDKKILAADRVNSAPVSIANGTVGREYVSETIVLPPDVAYDYTFEGLGQTGLQAVMAESGNMFNIQGVPTTAGDFDVTIRYKYRGWEPGQPLLERKLRLAVNPDPRSLWRDVPVPDDIEYPKADTAAEFMSAGIPDGAPLKDMVAASRRGRSHAQSGKPRDDDFRLYHSPDTGWYIMAVADGAGSARYSRQGSRIACDTAVDFCSRRLSGDTAFEDAIRRYHASRADREAVKDSMQAVGHAVYSIVGNAAYAAHKAINEESRNHPDARPKDYATTLLLAICRKFDFGWFVASFWVGDGALCIYNRDKGEFSLMGVPDEGEYSGQTRFLTMPEIFADTKALYSRLRFGIKDDFTALMLMSDGVSDPMFGTDANLGSIERWHSLWDNLRDGFPADGIGGVDLGARCPATADQLLEWLNFWMPGEHDDRTIAILY